MTIATIHSPAYKLAQKKLDIISRFARSSIGFSPVSHNLRTNNNKIEVMIGNVTIKRNRPLFMVIA